jgi:hypothetical protein
MATGKSGTEQPAATARPKGKSNQILPQTFTKAYVEWVHQQQQNALDYQQRCAEAHLELTNTLHEIAAAAQRPIVEAQQKFAEAAASTPGREGAQDLQQLQQDFARVVEEASQDTSHQDAARKAYETYAKTTQKALEAAQQRNAQAFQKYFRVVKDGWANIDPENSDPEQLRVLEWSTKIAFQAAGQ